MNMAHKSKFIYIPVAAIVILIAVFVCAFCVAGEVAYADSEIHFEITLQSQDVWILSSTDSEIARFEGEFFNPGDNDNAASVAFKRAIDSKLQDAGATEYSLNFNLPEISSTAIGNPTFDYYTQGAGSFVLKGNYKSAISSDVKESLQYRTEDGEFRNYAFTEKTNGGIAFGQNVSVGRYYVRFVVVESFRFDGKNYSVARYAGETPCNIEKATPTAPDISTVYAVYGTRVRNLDIPADSGTWTLSEVQTEGAITSEDAILHVKSTPYEIKYDYTPHNTNYKELNGVSVFVKITPYTLRVAIDDAFSLVGEQVVSDFRYSILTPLIGDDKEEDLGVIIVADNVNTDVAGEYDLTVKLDNPDYTAFSISSSNVFSSGRYIVYATSGTVKAPDGTSFTVFLGIGFKDLTLRVELCSNNWWNGKMRLCNATAYRFIFENADGDRVYPDGSYTIVWHENALSGATHIGVALSDGTALPLTQLKGDSITVDGKTDAIAFFSESAALNTVRIASIVLGALCGVFGLLLLMLIAVYFAIRRYKK